MDPYYSFERIHLKVVDERESKEKSLSWFDLTLLLVFMLILPHTLIVESGSYPLPTSKKYILVSLLFGISYDFVDNGAGFSITSEFLLPAITYLWSTLIAIVLDLYVISTLWRYLCKESTKYVRERIILAFFIVIVILGGFSISLDGWYWMTVVPFPLPPVLSCMFLYLKYRNAVEKDTTHQTLVDQ